MALFKRKSIEDIKLQAEKDAWIKYDKALFDLIEKNQKKTDRIQKLHEDELEQQRLDNQKAVDELKKNHAYEIKVLNNEVKLKMEQLDKKNIEINTKIDNVDRVYSLLTSNYEKTRAQTARVNVIGYNIRKEMGNVKDIEDSLEFLELEAKQKYAQLNNLSRGNFLEIVQPKEARSE